MEIDMQINRPKVALTLLAILHVQVGLVFTWFVSKSDTSFSMAFSIFDGLVFSQCSLLGIWAGLSRNPILLRTACVVLGITLLSIEFGLGVVYDIATALAFVTFSTLAIAAVFLVFRRTLGHYPHGEQKPIPESSKLQFSIRHLLMLIFFASCLFALGNWLRLYLTGEETIVRVAILGLSCVLTGLAATWAMLGGSHPFLRGMLAALVAGGACEISAFTLGFDKTEQVFFAGVFATEALILLASLFVGRLCGFRLVRLS